MKSRFPRWNTLGAHVSKCAPKKANWTSWKIFKSTFFITDQSLKFFFDHLMSIAKNGVYSVCYENEVFAVRISRCPVLDIFAKFSFLFLFEEYYSYNNGFNEITHPVLGVTLRPLGSSGFSILIPCKSARKSDLSFRIGIS